MFSSTGGRKAFTLEGNSDTIAVYLTAPQTQAKMQCEFTGFIFNTFLATDQIMDAEALEIDVCLRRSQELA